MSILTTLKIQNRGQKFVALDIEITEIVQGRGESICERDFKAYLKMNFRPKAKKGGSLARKVQKCESISIASHIL